MVAGTLGAGGQCRRREERDTHGSDPKIPAQHLPDSEAQTEAPPTPTLFCQITFLIS